MSLLWMQGVSSGGERVPAYGGSYVEGVVGRPVRINPLFVDSPVERDLTTLIFSGLTRAGPDGTILPDLARGWDITPDGKTYIFQLRPRVLWHDGDPFDADDVVFTATLLASPGYPGDPAVAALWRTVTVSRVDRLTVRFDLQEPFAPFLAATTIGILPQHLLGDLDATAVAAATAFNDAPIGTGPFRLRQLTSEGAILDAYRPYHLAPPLPRSRRPALLRHRRGARRGLALARGAGRAAAGQRHRQRADRPRLHHGADDVERVRGAVSQPPLGAVRRRSRAPRRRGRDRPRRDSRRRARRPRRALALAHRPRLVGRPGPAAAGRSIRRRPAP